MTRIPASGPLIADCRQRRDDLVKRHVVRVDAHHAHLAERFAIRVRNRAADENRNVAAPELLQLREHLLNQFLVAAGKDRQSERIDVLVHCDTRDVLRALAQPGVDDVRTSIAQRQRDDLGANVVTVEARLGDQDSLAPQARCRHS